MYRITWRLWRMVELIRSKAVISPEAMDLGQKTAIIEEARCSLGVLIVDSPCVVVRFSETALVSVAEFMSVAVGS